LSNLARPNLNLDIITRPRCNNNKRKNQRVRFKEKDGEKEVEKAAFASHVISSMEGEEHVLLAMDSCAHMARSKDYGVKVDVSKACGQVSSSDVSSSSFGLDNYSLCLASVHGNPIPSLALFASSNEWILNSGASQSMTGNTHLLCNLVPLASPVQITTASGSYLTATSKGDARLFNHLRECV
jgi:hypothetical protein